MFESIRGKRAFVTGGSRGIGRAIALGLARAGADIVLLYAGNTAMAEETADEIRGLGRVCTPIKVDLTHPQAVDAISAELLEVDILVLNASLQYRTPWREITLEAAQEQINCNFLSSMRLIQRAVSYMRQKGWGRIVTVGSVQEAKPHPDMLVYSATKAAQTNMMQSLSLQLAPAGITVNNLAPGVIYTDRNREALADPVYAQKVRDQIPVGFYGQPEDCVAAALLLCSDEGRYITGQSLYVDGGKSL